jgi:hypothetical protein
VSEVDIAGIERRGAHRHVVTIQAAADDGICVETGELGDGSERPAGSIHKLLIGRHEGPPLLKERDAVFDDRGDGRAREGCRFLVVTGSSTCRTVIKPVEPRLAGFSIRKLKHAYC